MFKSQMFFFKFIIFLVPIVLIHCSEGQELRNNENLFVYYTKKMDELMDSIKETNQATHRTDDLVLQLLIEVGVLKYQNTELNKKVDSIQKAIENEKYTQSLNNHEIILKETISKFEWKFMEFNEKQNGIRSEILKQINSFNEKFDENAKHFKILGEIQSVEQNLTEKLREIGMNIGKCQKNEDTLLPVIIEKLNEIDKKIENQKNDSSLNELKKFEENQSLLLEDLKQTKCGLSNSTISVNVMNLNQVNDQLKTVLNESLTSYSGCEEAVRFNGHSGIYSLRIRNNNKLSTFKAYCLVDPEGVGPAWTIIQRRDENSGHFIDFNRTWEEYKRGFGDLEYDHWIGLDNIFTLTNTIGHELWIKRLFDGQDDAEHYGDFKISDENKNFTLISINDKESYRDMLSCLNTPFNTFDRGNEMWMSIFNGGGFWGPCDLNCNNQHRYYGYLKLYENIVNQTYIHLAIRRQTNKILNPRNLQTND